MTTQGDAGQRDHVLRRQEAMAHLGRLGLGSSDLDEVLGEAMRTVAATLGVQDLALFEVQVPSRALWARAALYGGRHVPRPTLERLRLPPGPGSLPGYAADQEAAVASRDLLDDPRFGAQAPAIDLPLLAAIAAPIGWGGRPWGVLGVWDRHVRAWTEDEVHFVQAVATIVGLTVQRAEAERELRNSALRLDLSVSAGGLGTWSWNVDTGTVTLSGSARAMHGLAGGELAVQADEYLAHVHPDDRALLESNVSRAGEIGGDQHDAFRIVRRDDGQVRWIETWGRLLEEPGGRSVVGVCADVTDRQRAEELKAAMLAREQAARIEAEAAREKVAFLSEASARLSTSLDPAVTVSSLTDVCVPYLADLCLIDLVDDDGRLVEHGARAIDEQMLAEARDLRRRRAALGGSGGLWSESEVADHARSVLRAELTDDHYRAAAADAAHLEALRRLDVRSAVVAPLVARGRVVGVLTLLRQSSRPGYGADDLVLAEELAARAALAIDNGQLFHSRNRVARSLQAALLPPALPRVPGLALAARYEVAEADVAIGGDFYDVIELGHQVVGVVVGDVCGRGPDAAALTGLMRHSVRTVVMREEQPSRVLAQTNAAVIAQIDDAKFCTAAYLRLRIDPSGDGIELLASSAGHPCPVIVRAEGGAELLDCSGMLIGVVPDPELVDVAATLAPGDAVVLYTDGVTEARNGRDLFGDERLLAALATVAGRPAEDIASGLEAALARFRTSARDDTAIVVAQAVAAP